MNQVKEKILRFSSMTQETNVNVYIQEDYSQLIFKE